MQGFHLKTLRSLYPYVQADPPSDLTRSNSRALKTYLAQSFEALPTEIYEFCDSAACAQIVLTHLSKRDGGVSARAELSIVESLCSGALSEHLSTIIMSGFVRNVCDPKNRVRQSVADPMI